MKPTPLTAAVLSLVFFHCAVRDAAALMPPRIADPNAYLAGFKEELQNVWPHNRTLTIVCHGHSVPAGYFQTPTVDTFNAYPHLLHKAVKKAYPNAVLNVIVTAIGGETSDRGAARFEKDVLTHHPDVLLIDYALNDRHIGLETAKAAWSDMIEKAKSRGVLVILLTPTGDTSADLDNPDDPLNQHAEQIRRLAEHYNVALADSLAGFKSYVAAGGRLADLMSQANHPNRKGHDVVVAEAVKWFSPPKP